MYGETQGSKTYMTWLCVLKFTEKNEDEALTPNDQSVCSHDRTTNEIQRTGEAVDLKCPNILPSAAFETVYSFFIFIRTFSSSN